MKSETLFYFAQVAASIFQSTHSMKSETSDKNSDEKLMYISIHSLNEEWDSSKQC